MKKQKVIIHGTGTKFVTVEKSLSLHHGQFEVIEIWDNKSAVWGTEIILNGRKCIIRMPHSIPQDIMVIVSSDLYYCAISQELQLKYKIPSSQIQSRGWLRQSDRNEILKKYECSKNPRVRECLSFMEANLDKTTAFNQVNLDNYNKYEKQITIDVNYDKVAGLFYTNWYGKHLYMKRSMDTLEKVKRYILSLYEEQNPDSPHCYRRNGYGIHTGDVILDGGAAEGFWALENIDKASYLYLVEGDEEWVEALHYTFQDYENKVEIINKWLGRVLSDKIITIDALNSKHKLNYIKMDIEGAESLALQGATETLSQENVALSVCTYHTEESEEIIIHFLEEYGFETVKNNGFMWFLDDYVNPASLRHGIIFARKGRTPKVYIWGVEIGCDCVYDAIKKENCRLMGIVDSQKNKQYIIYEDVLVCPPDAMDPDADYIIISAFDEEEVCNIVTECCQMGFNGNHIIRFWKDDISSLDFLDRRIRKLWVMQMEKGLSMK